MAFLAAGCGGGPTATDAGSDAPIAIDAAGDASDAATATDVGLDAGSDGGHDAGRSLVDAFDVDAGPPPTELAFVPSLFGGLGVYRVRSDGALEGVTGSPFDPTAHDYAVAVHPSLRWVYTVDYDAGDLVTYDLQADGTLARRDADLLHLGHFPSTLALAPDGSTLYVGLSEGAQIAAIPILATGGHGAPSFIDLAAGPSYVVMAPSGQFLFASHGGGLSVISLEGASGPVEIAGSPFEATHLFNGGMAIDPSGALLLHVRFAMAGLRIASDGTATRLVPDPSSEPSGDPSASSVVIDATGTFAYAAAPATGHVLSFRIDAAAGTVAPLGTATAVSSPYSVALDPTGRFLYVPCDDGSIRGFVRDPASGLLGDPIPGGPFPVSGLQPEMVIVAVP